MVSRVRAAALVVAFLALLGGDTGREATTAGGGSDPSARVTTGPAGLGQLLVPTRASLATAGWLETGSAKTRAVAHAAVVSVATALLVLLVARLTRRRPGRPWHHLHRHSAVLRAPPLLLTP